MSYHIPEHIHARTIHDETMILDTRHGRYLGLNGSGGVVWSVLADGGPLSTAVDELAGRYDIPHEIAQSDVTNLVQELLKLDLIVPSAP